MDDAYILTFFTQVSVLKGKDTVDDLPAAIPIFPPSTTLSAKTAVLNDDLCLPILHKGDVSSFVSTAIIRARKGWEQF
ncbi:uncharacterized protein ARMOST_20223 [Armillaria ostoyae]|uniref:Uncharacterized protein n=1 Tax=Armillaria ostoyae TaxID=47428 RepID=A0A284S6S2_ARMOS|nr:uncharacterized protein ARMOST_20223 [Armillaria ostoyae]